MTLNAIVGVFCLGALWTAALLVAASALKDLRDLRTLLARLRRWSGRPGEGGLVECAVLRGDGPEGALATHEARQIGRALDGATAAVAFRDTSHASRVHGGAVVARGTALAVDSEATSASVWPSRAAPGRASPEDLCAFDEVYAAARTANGVRRTIATSVRVGHRVFVAGEVVLRGDQLVVRAPSGGALIVAVENPRTWAARRCVSIVAFVASELLVCLACTTLALTPPAYGSVSTAGGVLCLAFFLGVTPVGVWLRDLCVPPSGVPLGGAGR
jgi:hypothetical protein